MTKSSSAILLLTSNYTAYCEINPSLLYILSGELNELDFALISEPLVRAAVKRGHVQVSTISGAMLKQLLAKMGESNQLLLLANWVDLRETSLGN